MRAALLALILLSRLANAQLTAGGALRFSPVAWRMVQAAPDSEHTAWCSSAFRWTPDTVYVAELHQTSETFDPPCGKDAIILKRPVCAFHYLEVVHWWVEHPRLVVAMCPGHFVSGYWPELGAGPGKIS